MVQTLNQLIENTVIACDRIADEKPEYAGIIHEMKTDLIRIPSAGHAQSVLLTLLEMAEGTYSEDI